MATDSEDLRVKQAEFLVGLFEQETGRHAADAEEIDNWMKGKSKEDRQAIRVQMELYLKGQV